jgi:23S rRNA pseudouridine2604 synthase
MAMSISNLDNIEVCGAAKDFPMRLNRFLALSGVSSRREADVLIIKKKVSVNGTIAGLGDKVKLGDTVSLGGSQKAPGELSYHAYFKPAGVLLDASSKAWAASETGKLKPKVWPADLLEKEAEGLVILTNDKRISRVLGQAGEIEREYTVKTQETVSLSFINKLLSGVDIGSSHFAARKAEAISGTVFSIAFPGTRRDIQHICESMHHTVTFTRRERIANVALKGLKPNGRRELKGKELHDFLTRFGMQG